MSMRRRELLVMAVVVAACGAPAASVPGPSTAPTPIAEPADIVDAFLRATSDPTRSFSMQLNGDVSIGAAGAPVDIDAEVDASSFWMTNLAAGSIWETVSVDGVTWDR